MTTLLYHKDSYLKECTAIVVETKINEQKTNENGKQIIILDQTIFYPSGGGQPHDIGTITNTKDGKVVHVIAVRMQEGQVQHEIDHELKQGDVVHCKLDWERRYQLQKMHTACHVLSSIFVKETGALITGNQLNLEQSRIDFSLDTFDREKIQEYINKANQALQPNHDVEVFFMPRAEAEKMPELSKLAMGLKEGVKEIRVVKIGNIDMQADGGTHVKNTREVGTIELIKCENKGKANRRLYFKLV
ncbi:alanyl-tRNA editing protein [Candidatus Woesearchaeota archaeon]|nr:alanyl-tRNA editing protein [Candidatus Woesearchaeota archaeon]